MSTEITKQNIAITSKLDINLTKEDLVDIHIDNMLTDLEEQLAKSKKELSDVENKREAYIKAYYSKLEASIIKKSLPNGLKKEDILEIMYCRGVNSSVSFKFKDSTLTLDQRIDMSLPKKDVVYNKLTENKQTLYNEVNRIKEQINEINNSGKRIRAKMVKNLMENSVEGKNILKILKTNQVNLLK
jgi:uncharacterized protein YbcI